jgi:hypothetical protein
MRWTGLREPRRAIWHSATQKRTAEPVSSGTSEMKALPPSCAPDRRSRVRFPLDLAFSYRTLDRQFRYGTGRTLNISSTGVLAESPDLVATGTTVELTVEWPAQLHGWIPIYLVMTGRVVRCEASLFAVAAHRLQLVPGHPADAPGAPVRSRPRGESSSSIT